MATIEISLSPSWGFCFLAETRPKLDTISETIGETVHKIKATNEKISPLCKNLVKFSLTSVVSLFTVSACSSEFDNGTALPQMMQNLSFSLFIFSLIITSLIFIIF